MAMIYSVPPKPGQPFRRDSVGVDYVQPTVVAFPGKCRIVSHGDPFFHPESQTYRSKVMDSPTWRQVFREAM